MKKRISVISTLMILTCLVLLFAGCSNKSVDASRVMVDEYYDAYDDYDAEDIIDLMDDDFIDAFDSLDDLRIILLSRIAVFGEIDDYKVVGTSYYKNNGEISVTIDVDVTYDRTGETLLESFEFVNDGEDMKLYEIYHETSRPYDEVPIAFFKSYEEGDKDNIAELFSNSFYNYISEEVLMDELDIIEAELGDYLAYELAEEWYVYEDIQEEDVIGIYEGVYNVEYEFGQRAVTIQLCVEDDKVKIYDIWWSEE